MNTRKLESIHELDPIAVPDGDELRFRLEVFGQCGRYSVVLLRWESLRVRPTFPTSPDYSGDDADMEILVRDEAIDLSGISAVSAEEAVALALELIERAFWPA